MIVDLDFETASSLDLRQVGASAYAESATTEVLCLVYGSHQWRPGDNTEELCTLAADPGVVFVAHNAAFEQAIWHFIMVPVFGLPEIPIERWEDTMATCAWKALPLKLEKAAISVRLNAEKDMEGNRLTLGMSRVNKITGMYPERTAETIDRIWEYCAQDVKVEGALRKRIGLLKDESPHERNIWMLDQKINQRGLRIDLDFVRQAQLVVDRATVPLLTEFRDLTGVNPGQVSKVIDWCGKQGVQLDNLQKGYLDGLLAGNAGELDDAGYESVADDLPSTALPPPVRRVLEIRQMLGSVSIKKLARMRACVNYDGRARGLLQYHAASTGLWGGRLFQPQNFPRGTLKVSPEEAVDAIMTGDPEYVEMVLGAPAIECVASSLRHALVADPNKLFMVGDFAGIQARIVLALAGQQDRVQEMVNKGSGTYLTMAEQIYDIPTGAWSGTKELIDHYKHAELEKYTIGKDTVLGCGFQMGPTKFHARYCPNQPIEFAEKVVDTYRKGWAPKVPALWYGLDGASLKAVQTGSPQEAYGVVYKREGDWLTATLPSLWQKLWYPSPRLFHDEKFDKEAWQYSMHKGGKMSQVKAYGGLETQNVVSGLARGLMVASMMRVEQAGMPIVLTVHDEIVVEVDEDKVDLDMFETLMAEPTPWSDRIGIPVAVEAWSGPRYKK